MKLIILKKTIGALLVFFSIFAGIVVFKGHIKDGTAKSWNAVPFIFCDALLFVAGVVIVFNQKTIEKH